MNVCDSLEVTVLVDNHIDMLMVDESDLVRQGMPEHFAPRHGTPLAENGLAFLLTVRHGRRRTNILLDAGLTPGPLLHNAKVLGIDLTEVDLVVLSHGHPDHFGGLEKVLAAIGRPTPVVVHPTAFRPRSIIRPDTVITYFNRGLTRKGIEDNGGVLVEVTGPAQVAPGVTTSGEIPTTESFEQEVPTGRICVYDGDLVDDTISDYLTLTVNVAGMGLVQFDPCGHAGVVSALQHARKLTAVDEVHWLFGGFHLGHPGISQSKVDSTAERLLALGVRNVSPMHCSGFRIQRALAERSAEQLRLMSVGTVISIKSGRGAAAHDMISVKSP